MDDRDGLWLTTRDGFRECVAFKPGLVERIISRQARAEKKDLLQEEHAQHKADGPCWVRCLETQAGVRFGV